MDLLIPAHIDVISEFYEPAVLRVELTKNM